MVVLGLVGLLHSFDHPLKGLNVGWHVIVLLVYSWARACESQRKLEKEKNVGVRTKVVGQAGDSVLRRRGSEILHVVLSRKRVEDEAWRLELAALVVILLILLERVRLFLPARKKRKERIRTHLGDQEVVVRLGVAGDEAGAKGDLLLAEERIEQGRKNGRRVLIELLSSHTRAPSTPGTSKAEGRKEREQTVSSG